MKIVIDRAKCSGIGICESIAPQYYEVDDGGELVLLEKYVSDDDRQVVEQSVAGCPTGALSVLPE